MLLIQNTCVVIGVKNIPNLKSEKRKSMRQCLGLNQNYPNTNPNPNPKGLGFNPNPNPNTNPNPNLNPKGLGFNPNLISILTLTLIPRG